MFKQPALWLRADTGLVFSSSNIVSTWQDQSGNSHSYVQATGVNQPNYLTAVKNNQPVIICSWHHQIMMSPFVASQIKKVNRNKKIASLASKHGDGRFVGKIMDKYGVNNISGSSRDGRKADRGIDMYGLKEICS